MMSTAQAAYFKLSFLSLLEDFGNVAKLLADCKAEKTVCTKTKGVMKFGYYKIDLIIGSYHLW